MVNYTFNSIPYALRTSDDICIGLKAGMHYTTFAPIHSLKELMLVAKSQRESAD